MLTLGKNKILLVLLVLVVFAAGVVLFKKNFHQKASTEQGSPVINEKTSVVSTSGTVFFKCKADFINIKYGLIEITPDLWLRAWTICSFTKADDSVQTITLPLWVENSKTNSLFISVSHTASSFNGQRGPTSTSEVRSFLNTNLKSAKLTGLVNITVTSGKNSGDLLKEKDPLAEVLATQIGEKMFSFGSNLESNILPKYSNLDYPLVLVYRIEPDYND